MRDLITQAQNDVVRSNRRINPGSRSRLCGVCNQRTSENKPYCIDHLEHHSDYVRKLMSEPLPEDDDVWINDVRYETAIKKHGSMKIETMIAEGQLKMVSFASLRSKRTVRRLYAVPR